MLTLQVKCEHVSYASVHGSLEHAPNYIFHIYPPAILHNYLPYNIRVVMQVGKSVRVKVIVVFGEYSADGISKLLSIISYTER